MPAWAKAAAEVGRVAFLLPGLLTAYNVRLAMHFPENLVGRSNAKGAVMSNEEGEVPASLTWSAARAQVGSTRRAARPTEDSEATAPRVLAVRDLWVGLARWNLWALLGWQDIKQRYRRSLLGPFWLTLSMGVMVGALGVLYGALFGLAVADYLPFLCLGFIAWGFISGTVNDGCVAFIESENFIRQIRLPFSTFVYRLIWRNLIILGHNFAVFVVVAVVFGIWPGWAGLLLVPGLVLICATGGWVSLLLGMICARFRDVPQIVASLMQVAFFLTPIIWKPELLANRAGFVQINPFYHYVELIRAPLHVELIRAPLLGTEPGALSWAVALGATGVGWLVTFLFFCRFRSRIAYWV
ncbi:MAG: ABC transporter permease [Candidatus Hydrogenedentes bacterium]|nr:ABC transporter permease [Candidatus Hydrogenedentota bacterium]